MKIDLFERLFGNDQEKIEKATKLFDLILSGKTGTSEEKMQLRLLLDQIKVAYSLDKRMHTSPAELFHNFHPNCKAALKQIDIFFGLTIFDELLATNSSERVTVNLVAMFMLAFTLRIYGEEVHAASRMPNVRVG